MKKILLLFSFILSVNAEELVVIANKNLDISTVSSAKIKMIFLKKQKMLGDIALVPINLKSSSILRKSFERSVLKMSRNRLKSFWTKEHYQGHRPPLNMKSAQSVISFVKKIDGAIGYIPLNAVNSSVKIIYKWEE